MQLFDKYETFVQSCDIKHKQLILMGNVNSDYAKTPPAVHILCLSARAANQRALPSYNSSATTIAFIFTNMVDNIAAYGVIHLGISDHMLIYAVR